MEQLEQNQLEQNQLEQTVNQKKKSKKGIIVLVCIIILAIVAALLNILSKTGVFNSTSPTIHYEGYSGRPNFSALGTSSLLKKSLDPYIALIMIEGTIEESNESYNQEYLLDSIDTISCDDNNVGIMLYINSPGGTVYEADELYLCLQDYKAYTGRPVYAYFGSMAASGGYYIGCAADYIIANRNTLTGSIGVIAGSSLDLTGLMEKYGISMTTFTAGENKNMLNYNSPVTPVQREIMQSVADEAYEQFTAIVADSRLMDIEDVKKLADGRVYTAQQAYDNGLIDDVGTFSDAISWMTTFEYDEVAYDLKLYQFEHKATLYDYVMGAVSNIKKSVKGTSGIPEVIEKQITPEISYPAYYYKN